MKKSFLIFLIIGICTFGSVFARTETEVFSQIQGPAYIQSYLVTFIPETNMRNFMWYELNFEEPINKNLDRVEIQFYKANIWAEKNVGGDWEYKSDSTNYTTLVLTRSDLESSLPKKYFLIDAIAQGGSSEGASQVISNQSVVTSQSIFQIILNYLGLGAPQSTPIGVSGDTYQLSVTSHVFVKNYYSGVNVVPYSPVRVDTFVATQGTDICLIDTEAKNANIVFIGASILNHAKNILTMNLEVVQMVLWIFKISIFIFALAALAYFLLFVVQIIRKGGNA